MIITGWQSCKYSIFYLASLTYRAVATGACCDARGGEGGTRPGLVGGPPGGLRAASAVAQPRAHASRGAAAAVGRPGRAACLHARAGAAVATWPCSRAGARDRAAQGHRPGHGRVLWWRRVASKPEKTMNMMSMEELTGKEKTKLGKASNGHGVEKRKTRRRRGRRGLPSSGGGCRRERTRWPEKLAGSSPQT